MRCSFFDLRCIDCEEYFIFASSVVGIGAAPSLHRCTGGVEVFHPTPQYYPSGDPWVQMSQCNDPTWPCVPRRSTRDIQSIDGPMIYAVAEIPPTQHEERALMYVLVGFGSRNYSVAKYARVCTIVAW